MSNIGTAVIIVLLYSLTPITGETLFKCPGENATLEFETIDFYDGTVNWYKNLTDGNTKLIAYKVEDMDPIVSDLFSDYADIDRDLNLILRNVSSELSGEYFREIVNGGIFNSIVNLYVMCAPSGKPIVTIERKDNGTDSVQHALPPNLGNPKANLAIKLLETFFTENGSNLIMQQYEICLIGNSIQCFEGSPCQNYTIQSSFVQKLKNSTEYVDANEDANYTFQLVLFSISSLLFSIVLIYILEEDSLEKKSFLRRLKKIITLRRTIFESCMVLGVLPIVITIVLWQYFDFDRNLSLSLSIGVPILIHLGLTVISIQQTKKLAYWYRVIWQMIGEIEALLKNWKTDNAEEQNCEVDNGDIDTEMKKELLY